MSSLRTPKQTEPVHADFVQHAHNALARAYRRGAFPLHPPPVVAYPYPLRWLQTSIKMGSYRYAIAFAFTGVDSRTSLQAPYSYWQLVGYVLCVMRGRYRSEFFRSPLIDLGERSVEFPPSKHRDTAKWWVDNAYTNLMVDKIDKALQSQKEPNDGVPS